MVDPRVMCRRHLLGEHSEIHRHRHVFERGHSITGRLSPVVQIEPAAMGERHDALADEMLRRGYRHESPYEMPDLSHLPRWQREARVDTALSLSELMGRCDECGEKGGSGG